jgi:hypothetical protein
MRTIARRKHLSKNTVSQAILHIAKETRGSIWIAKRFKPQWGHVLSVDGKVIRVFDPYAKDHPGSRAEKAWMLKKTWMAGVDVATKDMPHYQVIDGEVNPDLVTFFQTLKNQIGYELGVLVCDGNPEIIQSARTVYGSGIGVQLCVRHVIENLKSMIKKERQEKREETELLIGGIWGALNMQSDDACFGSLKQLQSIQETRMQKAIWHNLNRDIYLLTTHFRYAGKLFVPRYNNDAENLFRQVNLRLKSWNIFRSKNNAENYLSAWALARRFTKFTDCKRGMNKLKNGKAPLELAGIVIDGIDYLRL